MHAAGSGGPRAQEALAELCQCYWYPVYAFLRRKVGDADRAEDLTQGLFCELIEREDFARLDPERGRFRAFLWTAAGHHLARVHEHDGAQKRGGGRSRVSIDAASAETRMGIDPVEEHTPERAFARAWALTQLERALARVQEEYAGMGRGKLFDALRPHLSGQGEEALTEVAKQLRMDAGAVRVALHRMRRRVGQALRGEIAETVSAPGEVEGELLELWEALRVG